MNKIILYIILLIMCVFLVSCSKYIYRTIFWNVSGIDDYKKFPNRKLQSSKSPFYFNNNGYIVKNKSVFDSIIYTYKGKTYIKNIDELISETQTTAFIVIMNDSVILEKYANRYSRDSINRSFSVAKSITSILIGIAIDKGFIKNTDEYICDYLPELDKTKYGSIQIKHLLTMQSGIKFTSNGLPWCDDTHLYYEPDVRHYALNHLQVIEKPGESFLYNNYCTVLLGIILERTSNMSITDFTQKYLLSVIGTEYQASWSINMEDDGFEQVASGFNARAIDFAKIARLMLNQGRYENIQVVSKKWIEQSVTLPTVPPDFFKNNGLGDNIYYKYQWWGHYLPDGGYNYFASGHLGQLIYICPQKKMIICRFGKKRGAVDYGWHYIARWICETI